MSEVSDSYHLRTGDPAQVARLLRAVRRYGAVLATEGRYIPFLVDGARDAGSVIDDVVSHNPGVLVHYAYAEDHGLWLRAFDKASHVATIALRRRRAPGDDPADPRTTADALAAVGALSRRQAARLAQVLRGAADEGEAPLARLRDEIVALIGLSHTVRLSCTALTYQSPRALLQQLPATLVLKRLRGRADQEIEGHAHEPNEWCPRAAMPACMYQAVPTGEVDEAMLARHLAHWLTTTDWDDDKQEGFWLHSAYERALPDRAAFLASRIMNLQLAFGADGYRAALEQTLRGILATAPRDFDWEPYLARTKGAVRL
jgi:hypothetical protein